MVKTANKKSLGFRVGSAFVILILALIAVPNFLPSQDQKLRPSVKSGMYTLQTMVETYAVENNGFYPQNLAQLQKDAQLPGKLYWKDLTNPVTDASGPGKALADEAPGVGQPGLVTYEPARKEQGGFRSYRIYGYDKAGRRVQRDGKDFVLSNE